MIKIERFMQVCVGIFCFKKKKKKKEELVWMVWHWVFCRFPPESNSSGGRRISRLNWFGETLQCCKEGLVWLFPGVAFLPFHFRIFNSAFSCFSSTVSFHFISFHFISFLFRLALAFPISHNYRLQVIHFYWNNFFKFYANYELIGGGGDRWIMKWSFTIIERCNYFMF